MTATPAERPSMLSSRLNALVMPTSQTRETTALIHQELVSGYTMPDARTSKAATIWTKSLVRGLRCQTSSASPSANRIEEIPMTFQVRTSEKGTKNAQEKTNPHQSGTPPKKHGVLVCQRSPRGRA